ncbi:hypothetical protein VTL71DRAFT_6441 [Oculimacula yallundae]|uniref:Uncharacterized protein n=1 Tax=Oculimacula yallundae TaxID=86028 RepID=A0ABR4BWZ7_9HELO
MADASFEIADPLAEWGTPEWDTTLAELGKLTKLAEATTGHDGHDFNAINQLLSGLAFVISKFKLVRDLELRSASAKRVSMVTTFFSPTILALERSVESFVADRAKIMDRYCEQMKVAT